MSERVGGGTHLGRRDSEGGRPSPETRRSMTSGHSTPAFFDQPPQFYSSARLRGVFLFPITSPSMTALSCSVTCWHAGHPEVMSHMWTCKPVPCGVPKSKYFVYHTRSAMVGKVGWLSTCGLTSLPLAFKHLYHIHRQQFLGL